MESMEVANGLAQLRQFAARASNEETDRVHLLRQCFQMTDEECDILFAQGTFDVRADGQHLTHQWKSLTDLDIEARVRALLIRLGSDYSAPAALKISIFPLTEPNWMVDDDFHGVFGYVTDTHHMFLFVNPESPTLSTGLEHTIVHEYHHFWRMASRPEEDYTLLDALIYEGLAEHFVSHILGPQHVGRWAQSLTTSEAHPVWLQFQSCLGTMDEVVRTEYLLGSLVAHPEQFEEYRPMLDAKHVVTLDSGKPFVPQWAGYSLGYHLVCDYAARHPDHSLQDLTKTSATEFAWPYTP